MDIQAVKQQYEKDLLDRPNVVGVGIGEKAGQQVIKVFVTHKVPASMLQGEELIPKTVEGFETDVEEIGVVQAQSQ